jgi:hypothetical protein
MSDPYMSSRDNSTFVLELYEAIAEQRTQDALEMMYEEWSDDCFIAFPTTEINMAQLRREASK